MAIVTLELLGPVAVAYCGRPAGRQTTLDVIFEPHILAREPVEV
jgi:hypothetical protein